MGTGNEHSGVKRHIHKPSSGKSPEVSFLQGKRHSGKDWLGHLIGMGRVGQDKTERGIINSSRLYSIKKEETKKDEGGRLLLEVLPSLKISLRSQ